MRSPVNPARPAFVTRRGLLRAGILSAFGLDLAGWWRLRAQDAPIPAVTARADACILVWLAGGPSHIDTFDPKPDAPSDVRGEFVPIETKSPGVFLSEVFPRLAGVMDRAALVRSVTSPEADHDRATHHLLTGYRPSPALVYPSVGSVVNRVVSEAAASTLPAYVAVPEAPAFAASGYLTPAYDPFAVEGDPSQPSFRVRDLAPPDRLTLRRLDRRRGMVAALDRFSRDALPDTPLTASRDRFAERAFALLTSADAQAAFALDREPDPTRDRYGRTLLGQSLLLARRLVERGVPFVTVHDRGGGPLGWDTHAGNFPAVRDRLAPPLDQGLAALVADLDARGLLDRTLLLVMGEFGRTPKINPAAGRDHHGRANSVLVAGGGTLGGMVVGKTDARGDAPSERPVTPSDLAATVFGALGINPGLKLLTPDSQPVRIVDDGQAVSELWGK